MTHTGYGIINVLKGLTLRFAALKTDVVNLEKQVGSFSWGTAKYVQFTEGKVFLTLS